MAVFRIFSTRTYHEVDYLNLAVKIFNIIFWHYVKNVKYIHWYLNQSSGKEPIKLNELSINMKSD